MSAFCRGIMPRHAAVAVISIYLSLAAVTEGNLDDLTLTAAPDEVAEGSDQAFTEIPGFAMRSGATVIPDSTQEACETTCLGELKCRSFSFRNEDGECIWSTSSLTFDEDFMFASKTENPSGVGKLYHKFLGMSYRTHGWTLVHGADINKCEAMCTQSTTCKAYSSRKRDKLCLLDSIKEGITYSDQFNYFEKKGIPYEQFPLLPPGAEYSCTGSLCPQATPKEPPCTEDPHLEAMEGVVKAKMNEADQKLAQAQSQKDRDLAKVAKEEAQTRERIIKIQQKDGSQLSADEAQIIDDHKQKLAIDKGILALNFRDQELHEQQQEAQKKNRNVKEVAKKDAYATEQQAQKTKERELEDGHRQTDLALKQMAQKNEAFAAVQKMMQAKQAIADAKLDDLQKDAKIQWIKEAQTKKLANLDNELAQKTAAMHAANKHDAALTEQKTDSIETRTEKQLQEQVAESTNKEATNKQDVASQVAKSSQKSEAQTKAEQASIEKEIKSIATQVKEEKREISESEAKRYVTLSVEHETALEASVEAEQKNSKAKMDLQTKQQATTGAAENLEKLNAKKLMKLEQEDHQKEVMRNITEQKAAENLAQHYQEVIANATRAASMQEAIDAKNADMAKSELAEEAMQNKATAAAEQEKVEANRSEQVLAAAKTAAELLASYQTLANNKMQEAKNEANTDEAAANAAAKALQVKTEQESQEAIRKIKKETMEKLGIFEKIIFADVSAFVDSGEHEVGTDLQNTHNAVTLAEQQKADTMTALRNAKEALEVATKDVSQKNEAAASVDISLGESSSIWGNTDVQMLNSYLLGDAQVNVTTSTKAPAPILTSAPKNAPTPIPQSVIDTQKVVDAKAPAPILTSAPINAPTPIPQSVIDTQKVVDEAKRSRALETYEEVQETYEQAVRKANEAKANVVAAEQAPANTAFGDESNLEGELRILSGDDWKMNAYLKFPQSILSESDVIMEGVVRLYKFGGGSGPVRVHVASCEWGRKKITYTEAEVNPGGLSLENVAIGDDSAQFPEGDKKWLDVKLHGDILQRSRLEGDHICLRISGGPSDGFVTISSELTVEKPELVLYVKHGEEIKTRKVDTALTDKDRKKIEERGKYRLEKMQTFRQEEEKKEIQQLVDNANAPEGSLVVLRKQRAVYDEDKKYQNSFDKFAGLDENSVTLERDAAVASALNAKVEIETETLKTRDEGLIAASLLAANLEPGSNEYDDMKASLAHDKSSGRALEINIFRTNTQTALKAEQQQVVENKISAEKVRKLQEIDEQIRNVRCQTTEKCSLQAREISAWEARAEARLVAEMSAYDRQHGTSPLSAYDVMTAAAEAEKAASTAVKQEAAADSVTDVTTKQDTNGAVKQEEATDSVTDVTTKQDTNGTQVLLQLTEQLLQLTDEHDNEHDDEYATAHYDPFRSQQHSDDLTLDSVLMMDP